MHASLDVDGKFIALGAEGSVQVSGPQDRIRLKLSSAPVVAVPSEFELQQNYPNPFNPTTMIEYSLPFDAQVTITIFDVLGREVTTLVDETETPGVKNVAWSGESSSGERVSSGLYFYRLTARNLTEGNRTSIQVKKMLMMK